MTAEIAEKEAQGEIKRGPELGAELLIFIRNGSYLQRSSPISPIRYRRRRLQAL